MRRLGLLFALALGLSAGAAVRAQADLRSEAPLRISKHALSRMDERGVSPGQVETLLKTVKPFKYRHKSRTELGYYDPESKLFVARGEDGVVITVITNASQKYVNKLKKSAP